jgi:hypothetical protein
MHQKTPSSIEKKLQKLHFAEGVAVKKGAVFNR